MGLQYRKKAQPSRLTITFTVVCGFDARSTVVGLWLSHLLRLWIRNCEKRGSGSSGYSSESETTPAVLYSMTAASLRPSKREWDFSLASVAPVIPDNCSSMSSDPTSTEGSPTDAEAVYLVSHGPPKKIVKFTGARKLADLHESVRMGGFAHLMTCNDLLIQVSMKVLRVMECKDDLVTVWFVWAK